MNKAVMETCACTLSGSVGRGESAGPVPDRRGNGVSQRARASGRRALGSLSVRMGAAPHRASLQDRPDPECNADQRDKRAAQHLAIAFEGAKADALQAGGRADA